MIDWPGMWNEDDSVRRFSPTRAILHLGSLIYRLIASSRNRLYDRQILKSVRLACPVISVGNLTVGGTGKTPCVIGLAKMLARHGYRPAVLSRGYGGKNQESVNIVSDGTVVKQNAAAAGDEPLLIARSLTGIPVLTGAKRKITGKAAIEQFNADVLICDDAFQHRQIFRDIDIVLLDAERPLGNGRLLPRGELREPTESLRRADCILLTRADKAEKPTDEIVRITDASGIPVFRSVHRFKEMVRPQDRLSLPPEDFRGKSVCAFCGIARPASFKKSLLDSGMHILSFIDFPDHYTYKSDDLEAIRKHFSAQNADAWITTEKDAMRLEESPDFLNRLFIARIEMEMQPSTPSFDDFILRRLKKVSNEQRLTSDE
ncbi:MAG TPA: tetraacyldisaccharide 4'-kinase [Smithellaceae bacterium]|nr:tetraacyldisaccharide 4'-kinase [Smithellaceae bacterium]